MSSLDNYSTIVINDKPIKIALLLEIISNVAFLLFAGFATETYLKEFINSKQQNLINTLSIQFYQWWLAMVLSQTFLLIVCLPSNNSFNYGIVIARKLLYWGLLFGEAILIPLLIHLVNTINLGQWNNNNLLMLISLIVIGIWRIFVLIKKPEWFGTVIINQKKTN